MADSSARELQRQKGKISKYVMVGKEIVSDFDFAFLGPVERSEASINKAFSQIEQNHDKVIHSLFWFISQNTFDETALNYLIKGDKEKATEIWERVTTGKELSAKNYSCFSNLGTIKLLGNTKKEIKEGIGIKLKLIESPHFSDFVHVVADETYSIDPHKQTAQLIDKLVKEFVVMYSVPDTIKLFSKASGSAKKYIIDKFSAEPLQRIESQVESTKALRKAKPSYAYKYGFKLFAACKADLSLLKSLLGPEDLKYKMAADNLAKEVLQCGVDYFQEFKETQNPSAESLKLIKYAESIAVGSQTKERIRENKEGLEEWAKTAPVKEEFKFIFEKLLEFKDAYDSTQNARQLVMSCKPKLEQIKDVIGADNEEYLNLSSLVAGIALGMLVTVINEEQNSFSVKYGEYNSLKTALRDALEVSMQIEDLDMKAEQRNHFESNFRILKSIASQLGITPPVKKQVPRYTSPSRPVTSSNRSEVKPKTNTENRAAQASTSSENSDIPWFKIIGWGVFLIIMLRACAG